MRGSYPTVCLLAALGSWSLTAQTTVAFKDTEFNSKDWEMVVVAQGGDGGTPTVSQATFGGNPGAFRIIEITASGGSAARPAIVASFHRKVGAIYDPAQNGIVSIDYSEDDKVVQSTPGGQGQASGPALQQSDAAGKVHIYVLQSVNTGAPKAWTTKTQTGLQSGDFVELTSSALRGAIDPGSHPDFKKGAKPIQFGFYRAVQDTGGGGCEGYGQTVTSEGIDNWNLTLTVGATQGPVCAVDPRNTFLTLHLPVFHSLFPNRVPDHQLKVNVTAGDAPAANVDVAITSTRAVFTGTGTTSVSTATAKTDAKGVAQFKLNPPPPAGFDRTEFTAKGSVGTAAFTCTGSVTAGIGGLSEMLQRATDKSLPAGVALMHRYRGDLQLAGDYTLEDVRGVPLSDRGRVLLERALNRHERLIQRVAAGERVKLTRAERKDIDDLVRQFDREESPQVRRAAEVLRSHLKSGTVGMSESERQQIAASRASAPRVVNPSDRARIQTAYGSLPLTFESNEGQMGGPTRFVARGRGYRVYLTPKEAVFQDEAISPWASSPAAQVGMEVKGANPDPRIVATDMLLAKSNYLIGDNPRKWRLNVPHFAKVRYVNVYPGVDLIYYGQGRDLRFDFVVAPGSHPDDIDLAFRGADKIQIDASGNLVVDHVGGRLQFGPPYVYQEIDGIRKATGGRYVLRGGNRVGFQVATYSRNHPLVIDPVLSYSSLLGGDSDETAAGIAVDSQGNAYVAGVTASTTFPTVNPLQPWPASANAFATHVFVTKFNPAGTGLVYSTFIGGSGIDGAVGVAVDANGAAYVAGSTNSPDFPLVRPIQATLRGGGFLGGDAFVLKLDPTGGSLVYSTYLGGSDYDSPKGIAVDSAGNAYVAGTTASADFPVKNAFQPTFKGGTLPFNADAFVTKVNAAGSDFAYSTYLGGRGNDFANAIAVDAGGNAYVTGSTGSSDFPLVNAVQTTIKGGQDAFVTKINASGSALVFSTLLGGESDDSGLGIAVDDSSNVYVAGLTGSTGFPLKNAIQSKLGAQNELGGDAFLTKLPPTGSPLTYSTFIGGSGTDTATALAVGKDGSAYVAGQTDSTDFPTLGSPFQPALGGKNDGFVVKVNPAGTAITYATYLGGSGQDTATGIALDNAGGVYVAGSTTSIDFPITVGAFQTASAGQTDVLVTKIVDGTPVPRITTVSSASQKAVAAPESLVTSTGQSLSTKTEQVSAAPFPTTLGDRTVSVKDSLGTERPAALSLVSPKQIKLQIPTGTASGLGGVTVYSAGQPVAAGMIQIDSVAPGLFSADGTGAGVAQGTVTRVAGDGTQTFSSLYRCDATGASCAAIAVDLTDTSSQVFLNLMATGVRNRSSLGAVTATIGTVNVPVVSADPVGDGSGTDTVILGPLPQDLKDQGAQTVALTVDGRQANAVTVKFGVTPVDVPAISITPTAFDFGPVTIGQSKDAKFTVQNKGTATLNVTAIASDTAAFAIVSPAGSFTVAAGQQTDVTVRFTPTVTGTQTGNVTITSNDSLSPVVMVPVAGSGQTAQAGPAAIDVSPKTLDFGPQLQGTTKDLTLTISGASGLGPLTVNSATISNARFTLVNPPTLPATVGFAPLSLTVRYTPAAVGTDTGTLTISSNAALQPSLAVPLTGSAYAPGPVELKVDDGTFESSYGFSVGSASGTYVNRLTPPGYPATLKSVRIYFNDRAGAMDPGTAVNVLYGPNSSGGASIDSIHLAGLTGIVSGTGRWLEFAVKDVTITSGDFVVGFSMGSQPGVSPTASDTNSVSQGRSYTSPDGLKFTLSTGGNMGIRALVVVGP